MQILRKGCLLQLCKGRGTLPSHWSGWTAPPPQGCRSGGSDCPGWVQPPESGQRWGAEKGNKPTDAHSLPVPDTTDFQESFVTSGVFSVTELIQVSRSECPPYPGLGPR